MGFFNELKKLTKPYSGEEYDDFGDEFPEAPQETSVIPAEPPRRNTAQSERRNPFSEPDTRQSTASKREKVVDLSQSSGRTQLVLVRPERFEAAAEIADHLRSRRAVFLNLEHTQKEVARRLVDFLSGVAYALDGKVSRFTSNTYVIAPYNVDIMGDLLDELQQSGLY